MGLLDRYRRFDDLPPEELRRSLRERSRHERETTRRGTSLLDLSRTVWPRLPNTEVANAAIAVARTSLNVYPDPRAEAVRQKVADGHGVAMAQVVMGNGAAELLASAAGTLLEPGDELLSPWPSYPLYPRLAHLAGADFVPVESVERELDADALLSSVSDRTRIVALCNPNDPTGAYMPSGPLAALLERLPERVHVLLDEALIHFQTVEPVDAALALVERFPRLLVFRSFSKAYALAGLRAGYVVGAPAASELLDSLSPALGVDAMTQTAVAYALDRGANDIEGRRALVAAERRRLLDRLPELSLEAVPSEANFIWLRVPGLRSGELAEKLKLSNILVAPGEDFGEGDHVRAAVRDPEATDRLLASLEAVAAEAQSAA